MNRTETTSPSRTTAVGRRPNLAKIIRWHGRAAIVVGAFGILHIGHLLSSLGGEETHRTVGASLRLVYLHPLIEPALWAAVVLQVVTGVLLWWQTRDRQKLRMRRWSGFVLALFLLQHSAAVLVQRHVLGGATDFQWAASVLHFPLGWYFVPYYTLGVTCFIGHLGAALVRERHFAIALSGFVVSLLILAGLAGG